MVRRIDPIAFEHIRQYRIRFATLQTDGPCLVAPPGLAHSAGPKLRVPSYMEDQARPGSVGEGWEVMETRRARTRRKECGQGRIASGTSRSIGRVCNWETLPGQDEQRIG